MQTNTNSWMILRNSILGGRHGLPERQRVMATSPLSSFILLTHSKARGPFIFLGFGKKMLIFSLFYQMNLE
jgi:hypothetical protein